MPWLWLPIFAWMAVIFAMSSIPIRQAPGILDFPFSDKLIHTGEYAVLGFLIARLVGRRTAGTLVIALTAVLALCYGVTDEIHQLYVPNRHFDLRDMMADLIGGALGGCVWFIGHRRGLFSRWW
jgi:VanZ family protein